eukprot:5539698-Ditylum_brightwellii.AAC.1
MRSAISKLTKSTKYLREGFNSKGPSRRFAQSALGKMLSLLLLRHNLSSGIVSGLFEVETNNLSSGIGSGVSQLISFWSNDSHLQDAFKKRGDALKITVGASDFSVKEDGTDVLASTSFRFS